MKKLLSSFSDSIQDLHQIVSLQLASVTYTSLQKQGCKIFSLKLILGEVVQIHCHNSRFRCNAQHVQTEMRFTGFPVYDGLAHHVCPFWAVVLDGIYDNVQRGLGSIQRQTGIVMLFKNSLFFNMYLFMTVLGLRYSMQVFSSCCE